MESPVGRAVAGRDEPGGSRRQSTTVVAVGLLCPALIVGGVVPIHRAAVAAQHAEAEDCAMGNPESAGCGFHLSALTRTVSRGFVWTSLVLFGGAMALLVAGDRARPLPARRLLRHALVSALGAPVASALLWLYGGAAVLALLRL
jgi:hypothetical protein